MEFILKLRIVILTCIFIVVLLTIITTTGKEWETSDTDIDLTKVKAKVKATYWLWDYCCDAKEFGRVCLSINNVWKVFMRTKKIKSSVTGQDCFI